MDIKALDKALLDLEKKRIELQALNYNSPKYDDLEEELHDLEDDFLDDFGDYLETILQEVHDKYCPESDVLLPIAYLGEGVLVESEDHPNKEVKLSLIPGPPRMILKVGKEKEETVWPKK